MYLRLLYFVVAFIFLGAAANMPSKNPSPPIREKQDTPTDQKDKGIKSKSPVAPSAPHIIINNPPTGEQKNPPPKEPNPWPPMWTIVVGLIITGLASLAALFTIGSIRGQAQAATAQAKTTAAQVELMAKSERPWMMSKSGDPNNGRITNLQ